MDEDAAAAPAPAPAGGSEGSTSSTSSTCRLASPKAIAVSSTQSVLTQVEAGLHPSLKAAEVKVTEAMQQFVQDIESRISASLKQAAGDVIAHLGKEAAARVLAAERKVAFLEQELMNGKEQALSMLLRLKHATDTQTFDLEKQLSVQRTRAEDAEAKVATLQDLVKRLKSQCKKTLGRTLRLPISVATLQEEVPENRGRVATDSLSLIAGVACDVIGQQPESTLFYHDIGPSGTDCSSPSEGKDRFKQPHEETSNGAVELESSCAQNASIMDTHNSDAIPVDMPGRNPDVVRFDVTGHCDVGCASADVRDRTSLEMTSRHHSGHETFSSDTGDDVSNEASGVSSLAAPGLGPKHFPIENPGGQRGKRKSRRVSSSEKLSRLMVGCKRARGMKVSSKASTGEYTDPKRSVVVESCRDSRRLMQGARQLFSLAERKW